METVSTDKQIAGFFSLLAVETRIKILRLLGTKPLCVNALARQLRLTQSAVSQHLRVLRNVKLVDGEKRGCFVHYRFISQYLEPWQKEILSILEIHLPEKEQDGPVMCCKENTEKGEYECNH